MPLSTSIFRKTITCSLEATEVKVYSVLDLFHPPLPPSHLCLCRIPSDPLGGRSAIHWDSRGECPSLLTFVLLSSYSPFSPSLCLYILHSILLPSSLSFSPHLCPSPLLPVLISLSSSFSPLPFPSLLLFVLLSSSLSFSSNLCPYWDSRG